MLGDREGGAGEAESGAEGKEPDDWGLAPELLAVKRLFAVKGD